MKWARVQSDDETVFVGVIVNDTFEPRADLGSDHVTGPIMDMNTLKLLPPVEPGKFIGLWNNFKAAAEKGGMQHPDHPLYFFMADTAVSGPNAKICIPQSAGRVVFEGELGIVIGKKCKNISIEDAADAILGFTCVNDFTSIDILHADPSFPQWTRSKSFDGFGVIGPVIETDIDWNDLTIRVLVNERERQCYPASDMILSPEKIISCLSRDMTLNPGDVIACGTSIGARPVKPGMIVEVVIDGIGTLPVQIV